MCVVRCEMQHNTETCRLNPRYYLVSAYIQNQEMLWTHSAGSRLMNQSMAAENAANAIPPPNAALGPEFRARMPPEMNPAVIGLTISFLARYWIPNV